MPDGATAFLDLQTLIAPLTSQCREIADWPLARFEVHTYLHHELPPEPVITSVRAVVLREREALEVLVVQDPDGYHILPGGRREQGETLHETVMREVVEETGWQSTINGLLGFNYYDRLTPKPSEISYPHPAFVQVVYLAEAVSYLPTGRVVDGYEIGAEFVAVATLERYHLTTGETIFLQTALQQRGK